MNTLIKVARLHLVDRLSYTVLPWGVLASTFVINLAIFAIIDPPEEGFYTGALVTLFIFMVVLGVAAITRALPFAFTLGLSRRTYYLGTVLLVVVVCGAWASLVTALWAVEGWTGGWWRNIHFFRVPWILDGPWYQVLLTSFVLLVLMFLAGMWYGLVYRRFGTSGVVVLSAALGIAVLALAWLITVTDAWAAVGAFLADLNVIGATGLLALVAALLGLGGFGTIRRITV